MELNPHWRRRAFVLAAHPSALPYLTVIRLPEERGREGERGGEGEGGERGRGGRRGGD